MEGQEYLRQVIDKLCFCRSTHFPSTYSLRVPDASKDDTKEMARCVELNKSTDPEGNENCKCVASGDRDEGRMDSPRGLPPRKSHLTNSTPKGRSIKAMTLESFPWLCTVRLGAQVFPSVSRTTAADCQFTHFHLGHPGCAANTIQHTNRGEVPATRFLLFQSIVDFTIAPAAAES